MLSKMESEGAAYDDVLKEAQALGFAEGGEGTQEPLAMADASRSRCAIYIGRAYCPSNAWFIQRQSRVCLFVTEDRVFRLAILFLGRVMKDSSLASFSWAICSARRVAHVGRPVRSCRAFPSRSGSDSRRGGLRRPGKDCSSHEASVRYNGLVQLGEKRGRDPHGSELKLRRASPLAASRSSNGKIRVLPPRGE